MIHFWEMRTVAAVVAAAKAVAASTDNMGKIQCVCWYTKRCRQFNICIHIEMQQFSITSGNQMHRFFCHLRLFFFGARGCTCVHQHAHDKKTTFEG